MHVWLGKMAPRTPAPSRIGGERRIDGTAGERDAGDVGRSPDEAPDTRDSERSRGPGPDRRSEPRDGARRPRPPGLW